MKRRIKNNSVKQIMKVLLIFTAFVLLLASCSEDFLEPKALSFHNPDDVFTDIEGFESGLVTVRKDIKTDFYGNRNPLQLEYVSSDFGYGIALEDWTIITPSTGSFFPIIPLFSDIYRYIKNANVIISRIDDIQWDNQEDRNRILGTAMFYRAWWYYQLITTYGDVPYIGYELKEARLDFYTHSRWTILEKIITDVEYALEWLPETSNAGDINKYVALHFLAKLYLANSEFDKAINAAAAVINGPYELMRERFGSDAADENYNVIWDLHRPENKSIATNKESIWTVIDRADAPVEAKTFSYTMRGYHCPWWYTWVLDSEGKNGTIPEGEQYYALGRGNPDVNQSYWFSYDLWNESGYTWKNTPDLRRSNACWWEMDEILYNRTTSVDYGKPINTDYLANKYDSLKLWPMPYYKTFYPHEDDYTGTPYGGNGDSYIFRLAETYLIRAEAYFWKGETDLAAADINVVRERSNAVPISAGDVSIDFIADERLRELSHEEFRHSELVRIANIMAKNGINGYSLDNLHENNWWYDRVMKYNTWYRFGLVGPTRYQTEPKYIYWPINVNIITTNTKGVINQNKGYEGAENNVTPLTEIIDEGRSY